MRNAELNLIARRNKYVNSFPPYIRLELSLNLPLSEDMDATVDQSSFATESGLQIGLS